MGKPAKELRESEKTLYYERMAFVIELPDITETVSGNSLSLTIGGVRAYNHENLYNRKSEEKFKVFVGFKNKVCTNLCVFTDGAYREIKARTLNELSFEIFNLLSGFEPARQINFLKSFGNYELTESQFAHLLGKARMFQHLPLKQKAGLQSFPLSDTQVGSVAREYYMDESFSRNDNGSLDLWRLYNLFTGANKSSYIDTFLDRGASCFSFTSFLKEQLCFTSKRKLIRLYCPFKVICKFNVPPLEINGEYDVEAVKMTLKLENVFIIEGNAYLIWYFTIKS